MLEYASFGFGSSAAIRLPPSTAEEEVPPPRLARRASQLSRSLTSPAKRIHMLGGEEPDFSRDSDDTTRVSGRSLTALADERAA